MHFDQTLIERLQNLTIRQTPIDKRYLDTYKEYIKFFARFTEGSVHEHDARIAVVLVYTWMGRAVLDTACWLHFESAKGVIKDVVKQKCPEPPMFLNASQIEVLKRFVGGSLIATSKFLHMLAPQRYAIWDRNVAYAAYRMRYYYDHNNIKNYVGYIANVNELQLPRAVLSLVESHVGREVSDLRKKEFALFHLGISELSPQS